MRTWNQLSDLEQAAAIFSDAHKDAYGSRPRFDTSDWTVEDFDREIAACSKIIAREEDREDARAREMFKEYEAAIQANLALGASDRATAIRWYFEANGYEAADAAKPFQEWEVQEVEHVLWGLGYPIRMWTLILTEIWPRYCGAAGIRRDLPIEEIRAYVEQKRRMFA